MSANNPVNSASRAARTGASGANEAAIQTVRAHHAELARRLHAGTEALLSAARAGECATERDELCDWYRTELLPHVVAEEQALYEPASELTATRLLIHAMLAEHRHLVSLIAELALVTDPFEAAVRAAAARAVFSVHLDEENDVLLPALDQAGVDLPAIVDSMHELLEHPQDGAALDVRALPHGQRHEIIFGELDALAPGQALVIVNDHDPKPLRYQTAALWPDRYDWSYLQAGPEVWRVAITRAG